MNLTVNLRTAIRRGVLKGLPVVDYDTQIRERVNALAAKALPTAELRAAYASHPALFRTDACVKWGNIQQGVPRYFPTVVAVALSKHPREYKAIQKLAAKNAVQQATHVKLAREVEQALASLRTVKQVADRIPEWKKYLPEAAAATPNLPAVVATVIPDLKRAGWKA